MFIIEDQVHAEWKGRFATREEALSELKRLANIPWDQPPNLCPCTSWRTCRREYEVIEFETSGLEWKELWRGGTLALSSNGANWTGEFEGELLK